ncbi:MAG: hypothetical protein ACXWFY_00385 [Chthoniobacterales bacterium]
MLKRLVLFACIAVTCFGDDDDLELQRWQQRHTELAAQLTPYQWKSGAVWRFTTTKPSGERDVLSFRLTDEPATTCTGVSGWKNTWRKLILLEGSIPTEAAYQVEGRALFIDLSAGVCDVLDDVEGVLSGDTFTGRRTLGGEFVGDVLGSPVRRRILLPLSLIAFGAAIIIFLAALLRRRLARPRNASNKAMHLTTARLVFILGVATTSHSLRRSLPAVVGDLESR